MRLRPGTTCRNLWKTFRGGSEKPVLSMSMSDMEGTESSVAAGARKDGKTLA